MKTINVSQWRSDKVSLLLTKQKPFYLYSICLSRPLPVAAPPHPWTSFGHIKLQAALPHPCYYPTVLLLPRTPFFYFTDPPGSSPSFTTALTFPLHQQKSYPPHTNGLIWGLRLASKSWGKERGAGAGVDETRLAMTNNCSAAVWVFLKIFSSVWLLKFSI